MKIQFSFILLILYSLSFSQNFDCKEDLIPQQGDNRMFGYINLFGEWKVIPFYDRVFPFQGNIVIVLKGKKYGLLNCEGKVVLRPEYDEIKSFTNGYAWVLREDKWGIIDYTGELILQPEYDEVEDVSRFSDFAWVKKNNVWGVFSKKTKKFIHEPIYASYKMLNADFSLVKNPSGLLGIINYQLPNPVITPQFQSATKVISNALEVKKEGKVGLLSDKGEYLTAVKYDSIKRVHQYRLVFYVDGEAFLADEKGEKISKSVYNEIAEYGGGAFRVLKGMNYGFLNYFGTEAIKPQYKESSFFLGGKAIVSLKDSAYIINPKNELLTKGYQDIIRPDGRYFLFKEKDKWGIMDYKLDIKLQPLFDEVFYNDKGNFIRVKSEQGFYIVDLSSFKLVNTSPFQELKPFDSAITIAKKDGVFGVVDTASRVRVPLIYQSVDRLSNNKFLVQTEQGFGVCDLRGRVITTLWYSNIVLSEEWPLIVRTKKGYGLLNEKGVEVIVSKYDLIKAIGENFFSLKKGKKTGVVDVVGKEILPIDFEEIQAFSERFFVVKQGGLWGYVDTRNVVMIPFQFEGASKFIDGKAKVEKNGEVFFVDKRGSKVN